MKQNSKTKLNRDEEELDPRKVAELMKEHSRKVNERIYKMDYSAAGLRVKRNKYRKVSHK